MEADDAVSIIQAIFETVRGGSPRNFEQEDQLIDRAIPIARMLGILRPRALEEKLGIRYEEALFVIQELQRRGMTDDQTKRTKTCS